MVKLGVTGGIGSGKSYVCRTMAEELGIPVYNCDIHARAITLTDWDVMQQLQTLIPGVYDDEGELDKQRLAQYLFASPEHAAQVNGIIHPAVRRDLHEWLRARTLAPLVAVESAILYESGFDDEVDRVLFVDAPSEVRIQRVMARDGLTRDEVQHRMASQRPEQAGQRADYMLVNDGTTDLATKLREIVNHVTENE